MHKQLLIFGFINCLLAVILGAFAAHSLDGQISLKSINAFQTGVRYQFFHGIAICICAILFYLFQVKFYVVAARIHLIGIILFSGSLYILALKKIIPISVSWLGPVTPIGGLFFIAGWILLIIATINIKDE